MSPRDRLVSLGASGCRIPVTRSPAHREAIARAAQHRESPSAGATISARKQTQVRSKVDAVYNYRPLELAPPPIAIYHPVFTNFRRTLAELEDSELTPDELDHARKFVEAAVDLHVTQDQRIMALHPIMYDAIHPDFLREITIKLDNRNIRPDGHVVSAKAPNGYEPVVAFEEAKVEPGAGNSDPIARCECDFVAVVSSDVVRPFRQISIHASLICPVPRPRMSGTLVVVRRCSRA